MLDSMTCIWRGVLALGYLGRNGKSRDVYHVETVNINL
jgi:hypothetical protein